MIEISRMSMAVILHDWIKTRVVLERDMLKYTMDSALLASAREVLQGLKHGDEITLTGEVT